MGATLPPLNKGTWVLPRPGASAAESGWCPFVDRVNGARDDSHQERIGRSLGAGDRDPTVVCREGDRSPGNVPAAAPHRSGLGSTDLPK